MKGIRGCWWGLAVFWLSGVVVAGELPPGKLGELFEVVDAMSVRGVVERQRQPVRLAGVASPLSLRVDLELEKKVEKEAIELLKNALQGRAVRLIPEKKETDGLGRLVAYLLVDDRNLNLELVERGYGLYDTSSGASSYFDQQFLLAEQAAQKKKAGIFEKESNLPKYVELVKEWEKGTKLLRNRQTPPVTQENVETEGQKSGPTRRVWVRSYYTKDGKLVKGHWVEIADEEKFPRAENAKGVKIRKDEEGNEELLVEPFPEEPDDPQHPRRKGKK